MPLRSTGSEVRRSAPDVDGKRMPRMVSDVRQPTKQGNGKETVGYFFGIPKHCCKLVALSAVGRHCSQVPEASLVLVLRALPIEACTPLVWARLFFAIRKHFSKDSGDRGVFFLP